MMTNFSVTNRQAIIQDIFLSEGFQGRGQLRSAQYLLGICVTVTVSGLWSLDSTTLADVDVEQNK